MGTLTLPALLLYLVIVFLAVWKRKLYFLLLLFVILAFPSPIDDIFPSIPLTTLEDKVQVVFPLFTRIDLYLILGIILKFLSGTKKMESFKFTLALKLFLCLFFLVFIINCGKSADLWDFNLLLSYSFHIRYFILFAILLQIYDLKKYQHQIILGFVLSIVFLFFEAGINTFIKGSPRLLSGSLSLNTFANISAAIALYMVYLIRKSLISRFWGFVSIITVLLIIIGSGTRGAVLAFAVAYFIIHLITNHKRFILKFIKVGLGVFSVLFFYILASSNQWLPDRYSVEEISNKINIDLSESSLSEMFKVKITPETTSIKSRLDLFDSSLNMIFENPWTGIGVGRWNRYKNKYSIDDSVPNVLLDTHNDYLALISQYGILLGLLFAFLIFLYPLILSRSIKATNKGPLHFLFIINFVMGIAAFSNAGFFKHQVSAVLIFSLCTTLKLYNEDELAY
ncbi:O-antigen ligase family protein [Maribacter sp. LLG6340-A2]|uniref:O-antigen ligase family protein n=1 Tax=Maribacter sp. LLG6340-A2 TaxID=3160834 RepID=UPI0038700702